MVQLKEIHPATWILWGLLMISITTNWVQWSQIKQLEKELAPVTIRPHIRAYEKPDETTYVDQIKPSDFYLVYKYWFDEEWRQADAIIRNESWHYQQ